MQVWILAAIGVLGFWLLADKSRMRELYPAALFMTYIRFVEQYILVDILHVWTYKGLPAPFADYMNTPVIVDIFFYPVVGYLFIQKYPETRPARLMYVVFWSLALAINEYLAVMQGAIVHKAPWGPFESYMLFIAALVVMIFFYKAYTRKIVAHDVDSPDSAKETP